MASERILVVDDEHSIRFTFALILDEAGYETQAVATPEEALKAVAEDPPELAFVDILLADSSGIDLLSRLRQLSPSTELVIFTGAPSVKTASEALQMGAFDYLVKPVRRDALLHTTDVALRHRAVREAAERYRIHLEAIFRSLQDGIVTADDNLVAVEVNGAAERLCDFRRQDVVGRPIGLSTPQCTAGCVTALRRTIASRRLVEIERLECRARHRPEQIVNVTAAPLLWADHRRAGGVLVIRDQTRLVELEDSLRAREPGNLIGNSTAIRRIREAIRALADLPTTVLITGESGTGKEVVADALYAAGRGQRPLVKVNCSALSEELLESELFGHVKGAFTGAMSDRKGRFELADDGTLFLDEVSEMSPRVQLRLLRVLETGVFERVGESTPIRVSMRVIAATNHNLERRVACGAFREDLYFRLKVFQIDVPPLRERRGDIPLLVQHLLHRLAVRLHKEMAAVSDSVLRLFLVHPWPGNVRELEHVLEYALVVARGDTLTTGDLPADFRTAVGGTDSAVPAERAMERHAVHEALRRAGNNKTRAARLLGISRRTLYRRLRRLEEPAGLYSPPGASVETTTSTRGPAPGSGRHGG